MFIIFHGEVSVYASDCGSVTCILHENQVFGERALERDELRVATVLANMDNTICLSLHKKVFKEILYVSLKYFDFLACPNLAEAEEADIPPVAPLL